MLGSEGVRSDGGKQLTSAGDGNRFDATVFVPTHTLGDSYAGCFEPTISNNSHAGSFDSPSLLSRWLARPHHLSNAIPSPAIEPDRAQRKGQSSYRLDKVCLSVTFSPLPAPFRKGLQTKSTAEHRRMWKRRGDAQTQRKGEGEGVVEDAWE